MSAVSSIEPSAAARHDRPADFRDYVWSSDLIYHRRYQKSLDAADAVVQVLTESPLLGSREAAFIDLYHACLALEGDAFARVWQDPGALGWAVYAYHSVGVLGALRADLAAGKAAAQADHDHVATVLAEQLQYFSLLAIGMHIVAGRDLDLSEPVAVTLPVAIPGTRFLVDGNGPALILGARRGAPLVVGGGATLDPDAPAAKGRGARITTVPLVTRHGCHFQLNPWAGQVPYIDNLEVAHAREFPAAIDDQHLRAIDRALDWMHLFAPAAFEEFRKWTRCLAVKRPQADGTGGVGSASFTFLPGLIHLKLVPNPLWLAESFIHEAFHHRLFFLDEDTHILKQIPGPAVNYSPWRSDPRPPHGVLHAVAVFIPVTRFMLDIYSSDALHGDDRAYALDFVVRQLYRTRIGVEILESIGDFTADGLRVFDEIRRTAGELDRAIVQADLPHFGPALHLDKPTGRFVPSLDDRTGNAMNSIEALLDHVVRHDRAGQATRWRQIFRDMPGARGGRNPLA